MPMPETVCAQMSRWAEVMFTAIGAVWGVLFWMWIFIHIIAWALELLVWLV